LLETLENRYKRLWRWASLPIEAALGNLEGGSSTRDFVRRMKGALGMERFSLRGLSAEGLWGRLLYWGPGRYIKKGSGYGHIFSQGPHWETWRGFSCWDFSEKRIVHLGSFLGPRRY